jgi:hypothetical protein
MKTKDYNGASIELEQYGNNILLRVDNPEVIINKDIAQEIVNRLIKNFDQLQIEVK